ncbi:MAG: type II secretion system F family protein [bacterium]
MPKFEWQGRTSSGKVHKGVMEAPNAEAVAAKLRTQDITPTEGSIKTKGFSLSDLNQIELGDYVSFLAPRVTPKDIIVFTRQFATMIDAGLPLVQCLELLAAETENRTFQKTLYDVKNSVESGATFADSLARHPKVFGDLYVHMVRAGEVGGILDTILGRLALMIEKTERIKKQIKSAMVYPSIVLIVAVAVVAVLLIFVVPTFEKMFSDMNLGELPALTAYVVAMSDWLVKGSPLPGWAIILVVTGLLIGAIYAINQNEKGKYYLHAALLKAPVVGDLIRKSTVASFTRTLGTLISSGVPIMDGLDIVSKVAGNKVVEYELQNVRSGIAEGKTLTEPLKESKVFPNMVVQMIGVGEQTGALDSMLAKIADFYEEEVDDAVEALTNMIEPLLMVFLGVTVGGLAVAMYLPIFEMVGRFGEQ